MALHGPSVGRAFLCPSASSASCIHPLVGRIRVATLALRVQKDLQKEVRVAAQATVGKNL